MSYAFNENIHFDSSVSHRIRNTVRAHKIALRYILHHHLNIICFCVAVFICIVCVTFFSSLFSGGILYQTKESAQHLSTKCRFCSNNASECRGNGNVECNIPFPIQAHIVVEDTVHSPHTTGSMLCFATCVSLWNMPVVFTFSLMYIPSTTQSHARTHAHIHTQLRPHTSKVLVLHTPNDI